MKNIPRLYVGQNLAAGNTCALSDGQAHYLIHVMRAEDGADVLVFNGRDGEWETRLQKSKKAASLIVKKQTRVQKNEAPLTLFFAPIKRGHGDIAVEKAAELGVSVLQPIITQRTIITRVPVERFEAIAIEASEQCERLSVPEVRAPIKLMDTLQHWPADKKIFLCAEFGEARPIAEALSTIRPEGVMVGPEGGFTEEEMGWLHAQKCITPVSLGPRILRADTAVISAISVIQAEREARGLRQEA